MGQPSWPLATHALSFRAAERITDNTEVMEVMVIMKMLPGGQAVQTEILLGVRRYQDVSHKFSEIIHSNNNCGSK